MSFLPPGVIATFAQSASMGKRRNGKRRKRKARATAPRKRKGKARARKPRPGTKAWMAYIRGKRKRK